MKIENIDIEATIEKARRLVAEDKNLSAASQSMFEIMILIITLLANRLNLNSTNSSKPPSSDPNRKKKRKSKTGKKPGGQKGHVGREHYRFVNKVIAFIEVSSPFYTFQKLCRKYHCISHNEFQAFRFPFL